MIFHVGIPIDWARRNFAYAHAANSPIMYIKNTDNNMATVNTDGDMPWAVSVCNVTRMDGDKDRIIVDTNNIAHAMVVVALEIATKDRLSSVFVSNFFALNIAPQIVDINPMNKNTTTGLIKRRMDICFASMPYNMVRPSVNIVQNIEKRNGAPISHDVSVFLDVGFIVFLPLGL